jgi:hypothetical protein
MDNKHQDDTSASMVSSVVKQGRKLATGAASKVTQDLTRERDKAIGRATSSSKLKSDEIVGDVLKVAAAGIGFVSEALHHRREKKRIQSESREAEACKIEEEKLQSESRDVEALPSVAEVQDGSLAGQMNEAIWALDDAERQEAEPTTPATTDAQVPKDNRDAATQFLERHVFVLDPDARAETDIKPLELPVIIPQRRPKTRARGFVRAYAPLLANANVDQDTFVDFIDTFNKVLEPNPWLYAINLAGVVEYGVPEPLMMLLGVGLDIATDAIMEAQSRFASNAFLNRINAEFFAPRGLVCFVATWKPEASDRDIVSVVDFEGRTADDSRPDMTLAQKLKDVALQKTSTDEFLQGLKGQAQASIKPSNGTVPPLEPAPLIFPSLEETFDTSQQNGSTAKKQKGIDRAGKWMDEYLDKRAQAKRIEKDGETPMSTLLQRPTFRSRYADPNHPASSGDVVAFLTGGRWQAGGQKQNEEAIDNGIDAGGDGGKPSKSKSKDRGGSLTDSVIGLLQKVSGIFPWSKACLTSGVIRIFCTLSC